MKAWTLPLLPALLMLAHPAAACPETAECNCSIEAPSVDLGAYDARRNHDTTASGSVAVSCSSNTGGALVTVEIAASPGRAGGYSPRRLQGPDDTLEYNIYVDSSQTKIFGDGSGGTSAIADSFELPATGGIKQDYRLRFTIPSGQRVGVGFYSDTIVLTVVF